MSVKSQVLTIIDELIREVSESAKDAEGHHVIVLAHQMGAFQQVRVRVEREVEDDPR
jgi:hypothetical protein